ncbi:LIM and SH3 domain protein F42H10.3 isoform X5 [Octopus sinensis]|uniref:LIM and SH3 domain protein F42H10.3 isoform X5 n=1 Tax=Octopus sinensis TaxID=2607531 RepID=A0A7E6EX19_9MOLL|nr:LIM and SH3 domain protein F42H10.3 isoform X5 [Octopus sinensis]
MNKRCGRCSKPVYPTEELKCLDKVWHKSCFKCEVCGMTLNMKNYKGYDKKPFCVAHYPTTKFTSVADTPENRRIATNTKIQSSVQYHMDFEKNKDKYTVVADNPDMQRCLMATKNASLVNYHSDFEKQKGSYTAVAEPIELKQHLENTKNMSLVNYHSDFEKQKGSYTAVAEPMDVKRHLENTKNISLVNYHSDFEKQKGCYTMVAEPMDIKQHLENTKNISLIQYHSDFEKQKGNVTPVADTLEMKRHTENARNISSIQYHSDFEKQKGSAAKMTADSIEMKRHLENAKNASMIKYHEDFEKQKGKLITIADDPELQRIKQNTQIQSEISYKGIKQTRDFMEQRRPDQAAQDGLPPPPPMSSTTAAAGGGGSGVPTIGSIGRPGKISDYDPYQENSSFSSPYSAKSQATTIYDSRIGQVDKSKNTSAAKTVENGSSRRIGSIADYDPMNNQYGSLVADQERKGRVYDPAPAHHQNPYAGKGLVSKAIYDYSAADTDEVSFMEGDIIIHCQPIDQGWMEGTVERTGERGMLPSNYVQTQSA